MPNTNTLQVLLAPLKPALIAGKAQKLSVLVRVQAPDPEPAQQNIRQPYHLALVIDRSGSMSGEPLLEAVRCARHIVDRLEPTDSVSLVEFDDRVNTLVPAQPVGDRKALHTALAQIHAGGSTNLHGGWQAGATQLLGNAKQAAIARVILLSDGNANVGEITETDPIAALCADAAEHGVTTSTYGLGRDFNEDLMVAMAKRGGGNHYYGDTAADLFEPFAEEFDFISNLYARQVRLALSAPKGVAITVRNHYDCEQRDGFSVVHLPDVPLGAEAWVIVELEIPAEMAHTSASQLLHASVAATAVEGKDLEAPSAALSLEAVSIPVWEALAQDALVLSRLAELEASHFLEQARAAAEHGDWQAIQQMMAEGQQRFAAYPWVLEVLAGMAELAKEMDSRRFRKEAMYSSRKMASRLAAKEEMLMFDAVSEAAAPSFLRRKKSQGKAQFQQPPQPV